MSERTETVDSRRKLRTWSQLAAARRKPTEYEIVTHGLNHHFQTRPTPFELDARAPLNRWYMRYREDSLFQVPDWNGFRDPRRLTYRTYIETQNRRETYLDGVIERFEQDARRPQFSEAWIDVLARVYLPSRYACHVLQMVALYVAQMAPSSYITNCAEFQGADEMRRIQRIAYRAKSLSLEYRPELGESGHARAIWENDDDWQPVRRCLEELLVAYDWGEAVVGLNLCVKPMLDAFFITVLGEIASAEGDDELALTLDDFGLDSDRSKDWTRALVEYALSNREGNRELVDGWIAAWHPRAASAIGAAAAMVAGCRRSREGSNIAEQVLGVHQQFLRECGLASAPPVEVA